jgi:hypothetical protein
VSPVLLALAAGLAAAVLVAPRPVPWRFADLEPTSAAASSSDRPGGRRRGSRHDLQDDDRAGGGPSDAGPIGSHLRPGRGTGRGRRRSDRSADDLALCADLLVVAALAGHPPAAAVDAVADLGGAGTRPTGPVTEALAAASVARARGADLVDALDVVAERIGPAAGPLVSALRSAHGDGVPLAPSLQRIAEAERRRARRRVEERVRRLPVVLLAPLVLLVLPAFVLVTIVPVGVATARSVGDLAAPADLPPVASTPGAQTHAH